MKSSHSTKIALFLLASSASAIVLYLVTSVQYKPYGVPDLMRPQWDAIQQQVNATTKASQIAVMANRAPQKKQPNPAGYQATKVPQPVAKTETTEHDFGILDPGTQASHTFTIRNAGELPMIVAAADTSCKCTVSKASKDVVQPGDLAEITLTWNTGRSRKFYRQYAIVKTNDPDRREIEFGVRGKIKTHVGFDVEGPVTDRPSPGSAASASWVIFSQTMKDFSIDSIQCKLRGFCYTTEPISDEEMKSLDATSGIRVHARTAKLHESGHINEIVRVSLRPGESIDGGDGIDLKTVDNATETLVVRELFFQVYVDTPISFLGPDLHKEEGLNLGTVLCGDEKVVRIIVRVREEFPPSTMVVKSISPSILLAEIEPLPDRPGSYRLTIRVPNDAPQTVFNIDGNFGQIEVMDPNRPHFSASVKVSGKVLMPTSR